MTTITIRPEGAGTPTFRASAGSQESTGRTWGEALDALAPHLPEDDEDAVIIVKRFRPDRFFNEQHCQRLSELMDKQREARLQDSQLPPAEERELEELIKVELLGAAQRADAIFGGLHR